MPDRVPLQIVWTESALANSAAIKKYLEENFGQKGIEKFYSTLKTFESGVSRFPELYPSTRKGNGIRRAVVSRTVSVFYRTQNSQIDVLAILDNRIDLSEWL